MIKEKELAEIIDNQKSTKSLVRAKEEVPKLNVGRASLALRSKIWWKSRTLNQEALISRGGSGGVENQLAAACNE